VEELIQRTGAREVHGSFSRDVPFRLTDVDVVKAVNLRLSSI